MNRGNAFLGGFVFAIGLTAGALAAQVANPPPPESPWQSLPPVPEPAAASQVAAMLVADDPQGLARTLGLELLQRLAQSIEPLQDVDEVSFTGATERGGDILSSYVAGGRDNTGQRFIVGVVFRVRDGKVIGVN
ncbi:MAG: hypothetical protein ACRDGT_10505 [Candidatus Limnocylindria bacterium]